MRWACGLVAILASGVLTSATAMGEDPVSAVQVRLTRIDATEDGELVALSVDGLPAQGLSAFQVELGFDPNRVVIRDPNAAFTSFGIPAFSPLGASSLCAAIRNREDCPDPDWLLTASGRSAVGTTEIDAERGWLLVAYGTAGGEDLPTQPGTLVVLELIPGTPGGGGLWIEQLVLADGGQPPTAYPWQLDTRGTLDEPDARPSARPTSDPN